MSTFLLIVGFLTMVGSLVLLVIRAIKKQPLKHILIILLAAFTLCIIGAVTMPPEEPTPGGAGLVATENPPEAQGGDDRLEEPGAPEKAIPPSLTNPSGQLKAHFLDVGQGDSILLQTPNQNILIDGGSKTAGATIINYLQGLGVNSLDLVISTHPHEDHIGGLVAVLQSVPVAEVIDSGAEHTTKTYSDYLDLIEAKKIRFTEGRAGMTRDLGAGIQMQILHPSTPAASNLNNASVVTRIVFNRISLLFTGDAESSAEEQILGRGYTLSSTILKVGHHGSSTSTSQNYLLAVKPETAVIMCGEGNSYGHPHKETVAKLQAAGVNIYRTDQHGTIIITTDGQTYTVNREPMAHQEQPQPPPTRNTPSTKTDSKPNPNEAQKQTKE